MILRLNLGPFLVKVAHSFAFCAEFLMRRLVNE